MPAKPLIFLNSVKSNLSLTVASITQVLLILVPSNETFACPIKNFKSLLKPEKSKVVLVLKYSPFDSLIESITTFLNS